MRNQYKLLAVLLVLSMQSSQMASWAQGSTFTYQGRLNDAGQAANGIYDFRFRLASDAQANRYVGSPVISNAAPVSGGLFTADLDFGLVFTGSNYWLEVDVRSNGVSGYTTLAPLQPLTAVPYAQYAMTPGGPAGPAGPSGPTGVAGPAGPAGMAGLTGPKGLSWLGEWSGTSNYLADDAVFFGGSAWVGRRSNANVSPLEGADWTMLAQQGATGPAGPQGPGGLQGQPGGTGPQGPAGVSPFSLAGTNAYYLNGFVGIGTTNPTTALEVSGTVTATGFTGSGAGLTGLSGGAITSGTISGTLLAGGSVGTAQLADGSVTGAKIAGGSLTPADLNLPGFGTTFWGVSGNSGTLSGTNFLGTRDNQPLELWVNGQRALRLDPTTNNFGAPNLIGGAPNNLVDAGVVGATIAGGGVLNYDPNGYEPGPGPNHVSAIFATICGGRRNTVGADHAVIGGGHDNSIQQFAYDSVIGGGQFNSIQASAGSTVIGGGAENSVGSFGATVSGGLLNSASASYATAGGGYLNSVSGNSATVNGGYQNRASGDFATLSGGNYNTASGSAAAVGGGSNNLAGGVAATVGGGRNNSATNSYATVGGGSMNNASGVYATVPGGNANSAAGIASFAAGSNAYALHDYSFVWSDGVGSTFSSTANNQFLIQATGGVGLGTASPQGQLHVAGGDGTQLILQNSADGRFWQIYDETFNGSGALIFQPNTGVGGYIRRSDGNYEVNSDVRLKQDISAIGGVLDRVLQLRPVSYRFRSAPEGSPRSIGLIAQEVEPLFPEVVGEHHGMKSMAYSELIPVTIRAIQELNEKLEKKEAELQLLEARNEGLDKRLDKLERCMTQAAERIADLQRVERKVMMQESPLDFALGR